MVLPFPQQVMKAQPREIVLSREKGSEQRISPSGARGDSFRALRTSGKNATGIPESCLKQIKGILNNKEGEKKLDKAGLKPE